MRKWIVALAALALLGAACAPEETPSDGTGPTGETGTGQMSAAECATAHEADFFSPGTLTVGTGNPAFPPWWEGGETDEHPEWAFNDPYLLQGFEGAFVGALADRMGFASSEIEFVPVKFGKSFAPGDKEFDVNLQQVSFKPQRAEAVDFSDSYYDVNQALVSVKGSAIENATTLAELQGAVLGAPIGTTSFDYIEQNIQPTEDPKVFEDLNGAVQALKNGQVDGVVVDLPSAFFITAVQIPKGVIVGQFPTVGAQEYFGLTLQTGNPILECVNLAIGELKADGMLAAIQQEWLADNASAPVIEA